MEVCGRVLSLMQPSMESTGLFPQGEGWLSGSS